MQLGREIRDQGYARFSATDLPDGVKLLETCRDLRKERAEALLRERARRSGKISIAIDLASDLELVRRPLLLDFALQAETCAPAMIALRTVPFLARVAVSISLPSTEDMDLVHFQRFHLDNDDLRHVKVYVNVDEVDHDQGPLTFFPAKVSQRILRDLRRGRKGEDFWAFDDDDVFQHASPDELIHVTGPPGSGVYIDASRCLHFGSRVSPARERLVYGLAFIPYHRIKENVTSQVPAGSAVTDWQQLLLDPPKRYPAGTFFPDWFADGDPGDQ